MAEEAWHEARLIPTSGISGAEEQERRATSALLAVLGAVKEFSGAMLGPAGAPSGRVETYIEVPFVLNDQRLYPDGLIRVRRGKRVWTALVEVKTGRNALDQPQLEHYLDIARQEGFDALITISNEIPSAPGLHPTKIDGRKLRKTELIHWSWSHLLTTAVVQKEHHGVSDPEQAWILGELIRYLEHPRSGALELEDMGAEWVPLREAVAAGTLRGGDKSAAPVTARFDALLRYTGLRLGRQLGTEVVHVLNRRETADPSVRAQALLDRLLSQNELFGSIRIPNTVGPIDLVVDLRAGRVTASIDVAAPREGRPTTRVNWLIRQLKDAPAGTRVEVFYANARGAGHAELLGAIREDPKIVTPDPKRELRGFRVAMTVPMGAKRGRGRGSFIDSVIDLVDAFYAEVVQNVKAWSAAPPRMRETEIMPTTESPQVASTAVSSQDGPAARSSEDATLAGG